MKYRICFLMVLIFVATACRKENNETLNRLIELETVDSVLPELDNAKIKDLEKKINTAQAVVEEKVKAAIELGVYYKLIGLEYLDEKMYSYALSSFQKAITIYPSNHILYYYSGICAGNIAKVSVDSAEKTRYFSLAEEYYKKALYFKSRYVDAMYGLGILYVYELDEPEKAVQYIENILEIEPRNTEAMFVLANAYTRLGEIDAAIDLCDQIIKYTSFDDRKKAATNLKQMLMGGENE